MVGLNRNRESHHSGHKTYNMRCPNCGYQNVSHALKCIKCNEPFTSSDSKNNDSSKDEVVSVKKTVIGKVADPNDFIDGKNVTPKNSKEQMKKDKPSNSDKGVEELRGTINPWNQPKYETIEFVPASREGQNDSQTVSFKSDVTKTPLNRQNLDPDNPTITRKVQAELSFSDGNWKLEDKSTIGTFVKVSGEHTLREGDQILMGDRIFTIHMKK
jgi:hypothetical protein